MILWGEKRVLRRRERVAVVMATAFREIEELNGAQSLLGEVISDDNAEASQRECAQRLLSNLVPR